MARTISRVVLWCGVLSMSAVVVGCWRGTQWNFTPVEGTVTEAGRPLPNVQVVFLADVEAGTQGPRARGFTDESGYYRLQNDNGDKGTVIGKYRVLIVPTKSPEALRKRRGHGSQRKHPAQLVLEKTNSPKEANVPSRYARFDKTPLRANVGSEPVVFDIALP